MSLLESNQKTKPRSSSTGSASSSGESSSPLTPDSQRNNPWPFRAQACSAAAAAEHKTGVATTTGSGNGEERQGSAVYADRGVAETVELVPGFCLTFAEAGEYLQVYRKDYMPMFPFVILEDNTKPHELYYNAPALFWMIMAAVAQTSEETDVAVKKWLRHHVAETMIIKQEKTLELLQAILVHLIWYAFSFLFPQEYGWRWLTKSQKGLISLLH